MHNQHFYQIETKQAPHLVTANQLTTKTSAIPPLTTLPPTFRSNTLPTITLGDSIQYKAPQDMHIYLQKIRGANNEHGWEQWKNSFRRLRDWEVDITGCTERNLQWTDSIRQAATQVFHHSTRNAVITVSNRQETSNSEYQPRRTATVSTAQWTSRINFTLSTHREWRDGQDSN
jgi:hypothetical protein